MDHLSRSNLSKSLCRGTRRIFAIIEEGGRGSSASGAMVFSKAHDARPRIPTAQRANLDLNRFASQQRANRSNKFGDFLSWMCSNTIP
jgi:hypothetical protein